MQEWFDLDVSIKCFWELSVGIVKKKMHENVCDNLSAAVQILSFLDYIKLDWTPNLPFLAVSPYFGFMNFWI